MNSSKEYSNTSHKAKIYIQQNFQPMDAEALTDG